MGNYAQTGLQASDAFTITKSDTVDLASDPNNKQGYKFGYVHVQGASGLVQVTPVDGNGGPYAIATTLTVGTGGTGYNNGTINGITLTYAAGKVATNVVANITVASGIVTGVTYVRGGVNADTTTQYQYTGGQQGGLGGGSGFLANVSAINAAAADTVILTGTSGTILGDGIPLLVRRVWTTGTTAGIMICLVSKGGGSV